MHNRERVLSLVRDGKVCRYVVTDRSKAQVQRDHRCMGGFVILTIPELERRGL